MHPLNNIFLINKMLITIKKYENLEIFNELAPLQKQVKGIRLLDKLGK